MSIRVLAYEGDSGYPLEVHRLEAKAQSMGALEPHSHRFFELFFIEAGRGQHRLPGAVQGLLPGDVLFVAPGDVHDPRGLSEAKGWMVLFEAAALGAVDALPMDLRLASFLRTGQLPPSARVEAPARGRWSARLEALHEELALRRLGYRESARAQLEVLLIDATRLLEPALSSLAQVHRPLLNQVFAFIDARFAKPISLEDVARAVDLSGAYLTDLVRRQTGQPVGRWILERRMAEARRLLAETSLGLDAIAERTGFEEASYFIKRFKAVHRITPNRWREQLAGR